VALQKLVINVETGIEELVDLTPGEIADFDQRAADAAAADAAEKLRLDQTQSDHGTIIRGVVLGSAPPDEKAAWARVLGIPVVASTS
jgi:hypothetical protein